jgi:hypothetical protein
VAGEGILTPRAEPLAGDYVEGELREKIRQRLQAFLRTEIEHEMQMIDFTQGGYIIPAFIDALDAYSTKITGYSAARVGQPLSDFDFEHFSFT